jgi:DNA-binding SARP family transcriptional activator/DNA-binding beta-propeller fold protein YncE
MDFRVLGPLEVRDDDRPVELGTGRQRKLLAILLLRANEVVSTDRLIDEVWDGRPPPTAAKALQGHVSQLRKLLGQQTLVTQPPGYLLRVTPEQLDALRAERLIRESEDAEPAEAATLLREALQLWRGPPIADFASDDFARSEASRLEELRLTALEKRIEADLALGRHVEVVGELEALVRAHPLRERLRGQLILALYRSGRQAESLDAFRAARTTLVEELGLDPSEDLQQLQRAILAHDPSLGPARKVPAKSAPETTTPRRRRWARAAAALGAILVGGLIAAAAVELSGGSASSSVRAEANSVAVFDSRTNKLVGDIPVGSGPDAVASTPGAVWVANGGDQTVSRIDTRTRKIVSTIGIGRDVEDLAAGFGSLWVADGNDGTLTRIDPEHDSVEATLFFGAQNDLDPRPVFSVATGEGSVWATRGNELLRIDPATSQVTMRTHVEAPLGLAVGGGSVWVATAVDRILRIDARTGAVTGTTSLAGQPIAPLLAAGSLWTIVGYPGTVWRLDPTNAGATATAPGGAFAIDLASGAGGLWIARIDGRVVRVDPATDKAVASLKVGERPSGIAVGDGSVWVSIQPAT